MQIHEIKRTTKNKSKVKVGRGGRRGKTSGRGHKGQKARAGSTMRPEMRDLIKKLPKLRGRGVNSNKSIVGRTFAVNVEALEESFKDGDTVNARTLFEKDLIRKISGKYPAVKILSNGTITKKLTIDVANISKAAQEKIEKAGGKVNQ